MRTTLVLIAVTLLLTASGVSSANVLENPGFETASVEPWEHYEFIVSPGGPDPAQFWQTTTENPHSGTYCAHGKGNWLIFQQEVEPMVPSSITEFTGWIRQDTCTPNIEFLISIQFDNPNDEEPGIGLLLEKHVESTDWFFYDGLADLQDSAMMAAEMLGDECRLVNVGIMGTFDTETYVDDWVLTPEPTGLALLCFAGLAILRRRRF